MAEDERWALGVASTLHALGEPIETADTVLEVDASPPASPPGNGTEDGAPVERYQPVGTLGAGGMGVVERCYDTDLMRELAVKRLRAELRQEDQLQRQFLWEARVGAYLDHPNIVPVHDLGVGHDGGLFFTMKLVRGASLAELLNELGDSTGDLRSRYPLSRRLRIFLQMAQAVAFAHKRGVVHRDLKPANVMVGDHGEVYVTDWGIAIPRPGADNQHLERATPDGLAEGLSGTPQYMSPEQAAGGSVDARSDVYALGAILYEMVALTPAFAGDTLSEILESVKAGRFAPLGDVAPDASPSIVAVTNKAMAHDPDDRYQSVSELAHDVERVVDGQTPEAEHASLLTRAERFYMSPDRGLARIRVVDVDMMVGAGMLLGVAMGLVLALWLGPLYAALALVAAAAVGIPPTVRWLRARKDDGD